MSKISRYGQLFSEIAKIGSIHDPYAPRVWSEMDVAAYRRARIVSAVGIDLLAEKSEWETRNEKMFATLRYLAGRSDE